MTRFRPCCLAALLLVGPALIAACGDAPPRVPGAERDLSAVDGAVADGSEPDGLGGGDSAAEEGATGSPKDAAQLDAPAPKPFWAAPEGGFTALFLDVGQGDSIVIIADDGSTMMVDGGRTTKLLAERLDELQLQGIDALVATHADADHIGGLGAAFDAFDVLDVYTNGASKTTKVFDHFIELAQDEGAQILSAKRGETITLGSLAVKVLGPGKLTGIPNDDSVVLEVGCEGARVLLTGDAEVPAESEMLAAGVLEDIDVLKVSHHGSKTATSQAFLDVIQPEVGIISAGIGNGYGHPHQEVIDRLEKAGVKIVATDTGELSDDTVMMKTDCQTAYTLDRPLQ